MDTPGTLSQSADTPKRPPQNLAAFRIYIGYRTLLSLMLLVMLISPNTRDLVGTLNPTLYLTVAIVYLATNALLVGALVGGIHDRTSVLISTFFIDILAIIIMADTSRGMTSGLPVLLVISVAASAILISQRTLATMVAAVSVLALLVDTLRLISLGVQPINGLLPAGLLGTLIFGVSLLVQAVAARVGQAEALARTQASDIYNLQRLNEQIVQNLQTGILLVGKHEQVTLLNQAASHLLAGTQDNRQLEGQSLAQYSEQLAEQYRQWRHNGQHQARPFSISGDDSLLLVANFRPLQPGAGGESLVFLEDYSPVTQFAQSLKLTSLGRLTASIAHEIRNPLGAISHAAQLLRESTDLNESDRRMSDIILSHSDRVNTIIESVMQISRREPPKPEVLVLGDWLKDFVETYLETHNGNSEVVVRCDYPELRVEFDPENLQRVIRNLLDNALRHSALATGNELARIEVELDFSASRCHIDVIDLGEGVPPGERAKLFEPFYTTVPEGSGMGLFLCKELCEINNASLNYLPTAQGESCFRLSLPQPGKL